MDVGQVIAAVVLGPVVLVAALILAGGLVWVVVRLWLACMLVLLYLVPGRVGAWAEERLEEMR